MPSVLDSLDAMHAAEVTYGCFRRFLFPGRAVNHTTQTGTTGGLNQFSRFPATFTMPSVGAALRGMYLTRLGMTNEDSLSSMFGAIEKDLGTLTGNSTATGVASGLGSVGTRYVGKPVAGSVTNYAASRLVCAVSSLSSGTISVRVTFTNQAGTTGIQASVTFPASAAVGTVCDFTPHFPTGTTGVRAVTGVEFTAGGAGAGGTVVFKIYGLIPVGMGITAASSHMANTVELANPKPLVCVEPGDVLAFYRIGPTSGSNNIGVFMVGIPETL